MAKLGITRQRLEFAMGGNIPYDAEIDSIKRTRWGIEIKWHMPEDPIACGKVDMLDAKGEPSQSTKHG